MYFNLLLLSFLPPGKPFSAIPMLTSTTGFLTNSQTPYTRLPQPDRPDLQPGGPTSQSGSAAAGAAASVAVSDSSHQNEAAIHKLNESQHEHETDFDGDGDVMGKPLTACYPSDAKFPGKHGAATLFFADCLSSKHKEQHKNQ